MLHLADRHVCPLMRKLDPRLQVECIKRAQGQRQEEGMGGWIIAQSNNEIIRVKASFPPLPVLPLPHLEHSHTKSWACGFSGSSFDDRAFTVVLVQG